MLVSTLNKVQTDEGEIYRLFVKGAPDIVKNLCKRVIINKKTVDIFSDDIIKTVTQQEKIFGLQKLQKVKKIPN